MSLLLDNLTPLYIVGAVIVLLYLVLLRPRRGGKDAPPMVLSSPGLPGPLGTIMEFGKGPIPMIRRCYELYGPVFTIPVSKLQFVRALESDARRSSHSQNEF